GVRRRVAFARLLRNRPNLIVMDEATSALDTESQDGLFKLIDEVLPEATLISVGHRPELEAYHGRKLVLEHRPGGARLIRDEYLTFAPGPRVALIRRLFRRGRSGETNGNGADPRSEAATRPEGPAVPTRESTTEIVKPA